MRSIRGIPDFFGVIRGRCVVLELKTNEGVVDPLQAYTLRQFEKAGAYAAVVTPKNLAKVLVELKKI